MEVLSAKAKYIGFSSTVFSLLFFFVFVVGIKTAGASGLVRPANNLGLLGYWSMNDGRGAYVTDSSGNGNTGTFANMEEADWVTGNRGQALNFDGSDEYVNVSSLNQTLTGTTLSAWFITDTADIPDIAGMGQAFSCCSPVRDYFYIGQRGTNWGAALTTDEGNGSTQFLLGAVTLGRWTHVTLTWDGTDVRGYVNGVETTNGGVVGTLVLNSSFDIGRAENTAAGHWNGLIDEVRLYSRALSPTEVAALYSTGGTKVNASQNTVAPDNLVLWHTFDGGYMNTTTSTDRSGQGNNGTLANGPQPIGGKVGQALNFNGSNNAISITNSASLNPTSSITISGWIYPDAFPAESYPTLVEKGRDSQWGLFIDYATNNPTNTRLVINIAGVREDHYGTSALALNQWQMITATYDGASVRMYKDAVQFYAASSSGAIGTNSNALTIGKASDLSAFDGSIDDVRIYNKALSAAEISQLYTMNSAKVNTAITLTASSGLVLWHTFDGPYLGSTTSTDRSGQGNNGTLIGSGGTQSKPEVIAGKTGQGLNFDGTDDKVSVLDGWTEYDLDSTTAVWFKAPSGMAVISTYDNHCCNSYYLGIAPNQIDFQAGDNAGSISINFSPAYDPTVWHHLVATRTTAGVMKVYIDAAVTASSTTGTTGNLDLSGALNDFLKIGGGGAGILDDMRIYNRALDAAEVLQLYNLGK